MPTVNVVKALRFENMLAQILTHTTFKHEKEGKLASLTAKLAGPAHFLPALGIGVALNAKFVNG